MERKRIFSIVLALALLFIGNRVFNHYSAWIGIAIMASPFIYFIYTQLNKKQDEED